MTLVESLTLAALNGFGRFIPISPETHEEILQRLLHFPGSDAAWKTTFALGSLVGLLVYFIHDWASIFSSFLRVMIYRKRPMTLDERLPFFLLFCALLPLCLLIYFLRRSEMQSLGELQGLFQRWALAGLLIGSLSLYFSERMSRKQRGPFSLTTLDSILFGLGQAVSWIPGFGGTLGILAMTQLRNYHLETATKLTCLMSLPFIAFEVISGWGLVHWGQSLPFEGTSWINWSLSFAVAGIASFMAIKTLHEQLRQTGFKKLVLYRILILMVLAGTRFGL